MTKGDRISMWIGIGIIIGFIASVLLLVAALPETRCHENEPRP
jgi:hypothetical protein